MTSVLLRTIPNWIAFGNYGVNVLFRESLVATGGDSGSRKQANEAALQHRAYSYSKRIDEEVSESKIRKIIFEKIRVHGKSPLIGRSRSPGYRNAANIT